MVFVIGHWTKDRISRPEIGSALCRESCGEDSQRAIDDLVVAKVFNHAAAMRDRGAVAAEQFADLGERKTKCHVREIHRHLPASAIRAERPRERNATAGMRNTENTLCSTNWWIWLLYIDVA